MVPGSARKEKSTCLYNTEMIEHCLKQEVKDYLKEQEIPFIDTYSTSLLCLLAAINDYSFSDDMINDLPQFIPTQEEINKYK